MGIIKRKPARLKLSGRAMLDLAMKNSEEEVPLPNEEAVEVQKTIEASSSFSTILKFNPYHDEKGRFTTADGGVGGGSENPIVPSSMSGKMPDDPQTQMWEAKPGHLADVAKLRDAETTALQAQVDRLTTIHDAMEGKTPEAKPVELTPSGHRPLGSIAREIRRDWGSKVNYAAKPYLDALSSMYDVKDNYYEDSGSSVVAYFLSNARSWRGPKAKELKKELNDILKSKTRKADVFRELQEAPPGWRQQQVQDMLVPSDEEGN